MKRPPEMSLGQFNAALKRNGFRKVMWWITDTTGQAPGVSWGCVVHRGGKLARRATLAKVLRERDAAIANKIKVGDRITGAGIPAGATVVAQVTS